MRAIRFKDKIISLEAVREVTSSVTGTGAKSNPFRYAIHVYYMNDKSASFYNLESLEMVEQLMDSIFNILTTK